MSDRPNHVDPESAEGAIYETVAYIDKTITKFRKKLETEKDPHTIMGLRIYIDALQNVRINLVGEFF
jgi:hypothetical protein